MADVIKLAHTGAGMDEEVQALYDSLAEVVYQRQGRVLLTTVLGVMEVLKHDLINEAGDRDDVQ
jgi:homogentisate 1,2-dioxygenase